MLIRYRNIGAISPLKNVMKASSKAQEMVDGI
jgi:hypothetical protein